MEMLFVLIFMFVVLIFFTKGRSSSVDKDYKYLNHTSQKHKMHKHTKRYKQKGDKYELQIGKYYQFGL